MSTSYTGCHEREWPDRTTRLCFINSRSSWKKILTRCPKVEEIRENLFLNFNEKISDILVLTKYRLFQTTEPIAYMSMPSCLDGILTTVTDFTRKCDQGGPFLIKTSDCSSILFIHKHTLLYHSNAIWLWVFSFVHFCCACWTVTHLLQSDHCMWAQTCPTAQFLCHGPVL